MTDDLCEAVCVTLKPNLRFSKCDLLDFIVHHSQMHSMQQRPLALFSRVPSCRYNCYACTCIRHYAPNCAQITAHHTILPSCVNTIMLVTTHTTPILYVLSLHNGNSIQGSSIPYYAEIVAQHAILQLCVNMGYGNLSNNPQSCNLDSTNFTMTISIQGSIIYCVLQSKACSIISLQITNINSSKHTCCNKFK